MGSTPLDRANINTLWTSLMVEEWVRLGVRHAVVCPGSRSAPLVTAVARHPGLHTVVHIDERGAAFYALGVGRATGQPCLWITTSGTAVANGLPAAVEAYHSQVPLLLVTADRPPELQGIRANQAIMQEGLFGKHLRGEVALPCPGTDTSAFSLLERAGHAYRASVGRRGGPVHVNAMFREPLAPEDDGRDYGDYLEPVRDWLEGAAPLLRSKEPAPGLQQREREQLLSLLGAAERGLVVVGQLPAYTDTGPILDLLNRLGWPVLADSTSHLRTNAVKGLVSYYDLLLGAEGFRGGSAPDCILHLGGRVVSKRLGSFLGACSCPHVVALHGHDQRHDPDGAVTWEVEADVPAACRALAAEVRRAESTAWNEHWSSANEKTRAAVVHALEHAPLCEAHIVETLVGRAADHEVFVAASSMPVRDFDSFSGGSRGRLNVVSNRGASGIDGTLATAAGYAESSGERVTVVLGDLAALHDLNSLLLLKETQPDLTLVVINNNGGGIFHFLPIARHEEIFERYFGTPHGLVFRHAAEMFGLRYQHVTDRAGWEKAYPATREREGPAIIEVAINRAEHAAVVREIQRAVAEALSS